MPWTWAGSKSEQLVSVGCTPTTEATFPQVTRSCTCSTTLSTRVWLPSCPSNFLLSAIRSVALAFFWITFDCYLFIFNLSILFCGQGISVNNTLLEFLKHLIWARHWWLTPVILATQKAEIRGLRFEPSPKQIFPDILAQKKKKSWKRAGGVAQVVRAPSEKVWSSEFKP
jgi:hypothetical protein